MNEALSTTAQEATVTCVFDAPRDERVEEGVNGFHDRLAEQVARR